jgi:hypothetical protein
MTTYHVELKDGQTGEVFAVSGDYYKELNEAFDERPEFDENLFYTLYPDTSIETYVFKVLKDLIEINRKARVVKEYIEKSKEFNLTEEREKAKQDLLNKYDSLNAK